ncbi:MAG TPA: hypothetical protein VFI92_04300 [Steroidobacteraceae bacterium]|nr:hypothetical protein [Steroidobacteraceae bacterium]
MKNCPKCRVESRSDAEWCWHCGYSYEDADQKQAQAREEPEQAESDPPVADGG